MTGCVAPREPPKDAALPGGTVAVEPPAKTRGETAAVKPEAGREQPLVSGSSGRGRTATEAPAARTDAPAPKIVSPPVKTAARAPAAPPPAAKVTRTESTAPAPVKPPALDLATLETRLKETSAIGVFTKLTLKNQVDDLLNRFRAYYGGRAKTTLAELRQPYDLLILKVLALLQDGDPSLARAVADSREAMWGILADPAKFKAL